MACTIMYEAEELGVHSVWLRGFDSAEVSSVFNLPKNHIPVMMFAMVRSFSEDSGSPSICSAA